MPRKGLTKEIKSEILNKVRSGSKVSELASEYGLSDKTIYRWLGSKAENNEVLELSRVKRQNEALLKLVGRLTFEQELKKKGFNI